jgi:hypothetical protein
MKILIGLLFLSIYGCIPTNGGYIPSGSGQGAISPDQQFPDDYATLQSYFSQFEAKTPTSDYTTMNGYFSEPTNIVTPSTATPTDFLENGFYQSLLFSSNPQGLGGKTVDFDLNSLAINNFYYIPAASTSTAPTFQEINPPPENNIPIGTIVLVSINATENGATSSRFQNTYMLKIQNGTTYWYVWYGNQNPVYTP